MDSDAWKMVGRHRQYLVLILRCRLPVEEDEEEDEEEKGVGGDTIDIIRSE